MDEEGGERVILQRIKLGPIIIALKKLDPVALYINNLIVNFYSFVSSY